MKSHRDPKHCKILQQSKPDDYVIATGKSFSVKEFVNMCCKYLKLKIIWTGKGINEKAYLVKNKKKSANQCLNYIS